MRRNSLSLNLGDSTPHSVPLSAVQKSPTPEEAKEIAKNLRSRKIKLITKHLRQSRVISFGLIVVLTCLLSAGVIEIFLRFFLPESENFVVPQSARTTRNKPSVNPRPPVNTPVNTPPPDVEMENYKPSNEINSKSPTKNMKSESEKKKENFTEEAEVKKPKEHEEPKEHEKYEEQEEHEEQEELEDPLSEPSIKPQPPSTSGKQVILISSEPVKSGHTSPVESDHLPSTTANPSTTSTIKIFADTSTQTDTIELDSSHDGSDGSATILPDPTTATAAATTTATAPLIIPDIGFDHNILNGFVQYKAFCLNIKPLLLTHFNYSTSLVIQKSTDLMFSFVPFTFKDNVNINKAYQHIIETFPLILDSPLLNEAAKIELKIKIEAFTNEKKINSYHVEHLNEFTNFWKSICEAVHIHPLYSPQMKATQVITTANTNELGILDFFGKRFEHNSTDLPLLNPVTDQDLLDMNQLPLANTVAHLILLLKSIEPFVYGPGISYTHLIPKFDTCHVIGNPRKLVYPSNCINLHIHYYNDLVAQIKPSDKLEAIKIFNTPSVL